MNFQINDRVVFDGDTRRAGTVVGTKPFHCHGTDYSRTQVLWDCCYGVDSISPDSLYPESITFTANRQSELINRIQKLEVLAKRVPLCGWGYDPNRQWQPSWK